MRLRERFETQIAVGEGSAVWQQVSLKFQIRLFPEVPRLLTDSEEQVLVQRQQV